MNIFTKLKNVMEMKTNFYKYVTKIDIMQAYKDVYNKALELNYFEDPKMCFKPAFDVKDDVNLGWNTGLPKTKEDEIDYYSQFIQFSGVLTQLSSFLSFGIFTLNVEHGSTIAMIQMIEGMRASKYNNLSENEIELNAIKIKKKMVQKSSKDMINTFIMQMFLFLWGVRYNKELLEFHYTFNNYRDLDKLSYVKDPLYEYIIEYYNNILKENPKIDELFKKFIKNHRKKSKLREIASRIKVIYYFILGEIRLFINFIFSTPPKDMFEEYKNRLFNRNFDNHPHYRNMFTNLVTNMQNARESLMNPELAEMFLFVNNEYKIDYSKEEWTFINTMSPEFIDKCDKISRWVKASTILNIFVNQYVNELMIESRVRNKEYTRN